MPGQPLFRQLNELIDTRGIGLVTIVGTFLTILFSVFINLMGLAFFDGSGQKYVWIASVVCPLMITPPFMYVLLRLNYRLNEANNELQQAIDEVQVLRGLLPICSSCKKIRDDQGYWNHIEGYIAAHSKAEFTHSICPDCWEKFYGERPNE